MTQYEDNLDHDNLRRPDWLLFFRAFRTALMRVKLWGATTVALLLLSLPAFLQTSEAFTGMIGSRYPDAAAAGELDASMTPPVVNLGEVFRHDHGAALGQLDRSLAAGGAGLALIAFLLGIFAAGGWLQVIFEQPDRQTLRRFGFGGLRYFGRFLRVGILSVLMLGLVRWIWYGAPWEYLVEGLLLEIPEYDRGTLETLESEFDAVRLGWIQDGFFALAFAKVMAWGIYTRTRLTLRDSRSALGAGIATAFTMMRHPIQTLRPLVLLLVVEALVVVGALGWAKSQVDGRFAEQPTGSLVAAAFGIGVLALIWRQITRGALYHAAGRVSQSLVLPTPRRPDPWAQTIGGPGGPQYPVVDDGYSVTV